MCDTLADSDFTSIQRRLRGREHLGPDGSAAGRVANKTGSNKLGKLRALTEGKRAAPADIWHLGNRPKQWVRQVQGTENIYYRAIGSAEALMETRHLRADFLLPDLNWDRH